MSNEGIQLFEKTTKLVDATLEAETAIVVHQGGTSSSKTYSILQALDIISQNDPGSVITVAGQDIPNLKKGAYRDAQNIIEGNKYLQAELVSHNRSEREFRFRNGTVIEFNSYDDEQDAKSGKRDYLFVNEANGVSHGIFEQLQMRTTKKAIIDFNPSARFWAHDELQGQANVTWIKSNYKHNPFIPERILKNILSYNPWHPEDSDKPREQRRPHPINVPEGTANEYRWRVYGLGEVGRLEGLVFPDFEVTQEWPEQYKWRVFGLDFGFTNDPTALVEIRYAHGNLYWKEHIYETGLTNTSDNEQRQPSIDGRLKELGFDKQKIIADSAEPKSIKELSQKGWNIKGAEKGRDSVNQGIDAIKRYSLYITSDSDNLIEEFSSYTWDEDKDGNPTNKPIDDFNHGIDGGRYALTKKLIGKPKRAGKLF